MGTFHVVLSKAVGYLRRSAKSRNHWPASWWVFSCSDSIDDAAAIPYGFGGAFSFPRDFHALHLLGLPLRGWAVRCGGRAYGPRTRLAGSTTFRLPFSASQRGFGSLAPLAGSACVRRLTRRVPSERSCHVHQRPVFVRVSRSLACVRKYVLCSDLAATPFGLPAFQRRSVEEHEDRSS